MNLTNPLQAHTYAWASSLTPRPLAVVTARIAHHSAGALTETVDEIHAQHLAQGWAGIGYSGVIYPNGTGIQGRPFEYVPAAAQGMNTDSIDICLIGNFETGDPGFTGPPTDAQINTLVEVFAYVGTQFPSIDKTIGHRDVSALIGDPSVATACPGDLLEAMLPDIRAKVAARLQQNQNHGGSVQ